MIKIPVCPSSSREKRRRKSPRKNLRVCECYIGTIYRKFNIRINEHKKNFVNNKKNPIKLIVYYI